MPRFITLGTLTQEGFDNLEQGPQTVEAFVEKVNAMGGSFDPDDFYVLEGEYDWAAVIDFPSVEAASQVADVYARTGRGRIQSEHVVAQSPGGYEDFVQGIIDAE